MQCIIEIDKRLIEQAQRTLGTHTVQETIEAGLRLVVGRPGANTPSTGVRALLQRSAGLWADRIDLGDAGAYVQQLRREWDRSA